MKRAVLHTLWVLLVLNTTSLYQVFKCPALFQHFIEHRTSDHHIGIVDFLSLHYWGDDLNDNDEEQDRQLPFKRFEVHTPAFLFVTSARPHEQPHHDTPIKICFALETEEVYRNPALSLLFRPPKF